MTAAFPICPACQSPDYDFLLGFAAKRDPLFGCGSCGHIGLSSGVQPTSAQIKNYLRQIDQGAFLEKLKKEETELAARTGDKDFARRYYDPLYAWFETGLAPAFAELVYHDTSEDDHELEPQAWSLFKKRMLQYPGYLSPNTLRAYARDFRTFRNWCRKTGCKAIPANGESVANYIKHRGQVVKPTTIKRELAAISMVHRVAECYNPADHIEAKMALKEQVRIKGLRSEQKAPVRHQVVEESREVTVDRLIEACADTLLGLRDRALLSVGMDAGVRGSELIKLKVDDFRIRTATKDGQPTAMHQIFIEKSKTDQERVGSWRLISAAAREHVDTWLEAAGISGGYVYRAVYRGTVNPDRDTPISERNYRAIVKRVAQSAGLPQDLVRQLSTHSFRIGAVQELAAQGGNLGDVMRAFDMKDVRTAARYAQGLDLVSNPQLEVVRRREIAKSI